LIRAKKSTAVDAAVGARIRHLRLRSKLSQTEVGKQIGVSFQQVQKYENGSNRVSAGRLAQLARLFGMPVTAFYSEIAGRDEKPIRRARLGASFVDVTADRLVKAFESIEDRKLKSVMLQLIEEMVRRQYRK
jgi:transcriptional regulator with XRE-family HTH domain